MKRCIKSLTSWWFKYTKKMDKSEKICIFIGLVIALISSAIVFVCADTEPATNHDYESIEKQLVDIEKDKSLLLKTDCKIYVNDGVISITIENDECKIIAKYDEELNKISSTRDDKCIPFLVALLMTFLTGIMVYVYITFVSMIVVGISFEYKKNKNTES